MRFLFVLTLAVLAGPAFAEPLRPMSECLDPSRARSWHLIDSDEILVDAGRKRFHLKLGPSCPELGFTQEIGFATATGVGRICGNAGDTVLAPRRSPVHFPCRIIEVTPLSKEEFAVRLDGRQDKDDKPRGVVEIREEKSDQR